MYLPLALEFNEHEEIGIVCFRNGVYFCSCGVYQWNLTVAKGGTYLHCQTLPKNPVQCIASFGIHG
jgi:hypothetical protein